MIIEYSHNKSLLFLLEKKRILIDLHFFNNKKYFIGDKKLKFPFDR